MNVGDRIQITGGPHTGEQGVITSVHGEFAYVHRDGTHPDAEETIMDYNMRVVNRAIAA
jgi:ribosomal protein L24